MNMSASTSSVTKKVCLSGIDCMFSCSLYPQVRISLKTWSKNCAIRFLACRTTQASPFGVANNENLGALAWFEESRKNRDRYIIDYDA